MVTIDVLDNDTDLEGIDETSVTILTPPSNGAAFVNPTTGEVSYFPNEHYNGLDTFTYTVCDEGSPALCDTADVIITLNPVNDAPTIEQADVTVPEDSTITFCPTLNDPDSGDMLTVTICDTPDNGNATVDATNCVTYTPNPDYNGLDSVCVTVCDSSNLCKSIMVAIEITPVNDPLTATDDIASTDEDTPVVIEVLGNDIDVEGIDPTTVAIVTPSTNGTTAIDPVTGEVTYTPNPNFFGQDTLTYTVCDNGMPVLCDSAQVVITVNPVNDPPVIVDDVATTDEEAPVTINVLGNDTDVEGIDSTTVAIVTPPTHGTTEIDPVTGEVTYTPELDFVGQDTITYTVCDTGMPVACDTAQIIIEVNQVNDAPIATDDAITVDEDTPVIVAVLGNDTDNEGIDSTSVNVITPPTNGTISVDPMTGEVTYTPELNYVGQDTFTYVMCDTGMPVLCDTAEVVITVDPVNDPPTITQAPVTVPEDSTIVFCPVLTDPDTGDTLTVAICVDPVNGSATAGIDNCITYTPNQDFVGTDSMCIVVCDAAGLCDSTSVLVPIEVTPINDPVDAVDDVATTDEETPIVIDVINNDTDVEGIDSTTVAIVTSPTHGLTSVDPLTGKITYTPELNFVGQDTLSYVVCDTGIPIDCDTAQVIVTVEDVNDPPTITQSPITIPEDSVVVFCPTINDIDLGNILTVSSCADPANGTATIDTNNCITYTPNPTYHGLDSMCVMVCDDGGLCDSVMVSIEIQSINTPPVVVNDTAYTVEDTQVILNITASNDTDIDGNIDNSTIDFDANMPGIQTLFDNGDGIFEVDGNGNVTFKPHLNFYGVTSIDYSVCDDGSPLPVQCASAKIVVFVEPVNDSPIAQNDLITTDEEVTVTIPVLSNDSDVEGLDSTSITITTPPMNGSVTVDPVTGDITYTPNPDFDGTETFEYQVCDDGTPALCDIAEVTVQINPENDAPIAMDDSTTTNEDTPITFNITTANDTDIDGNLDNSSLDLNLNEPGVQPTFDNGDGLFEVDDDGNLTFTPHANFYGQTSTDYIICDDGIPAPVLCDTATITINVTPVNDSPIAANDTKITLEDTPVLIDVLNNDSDVEGLDTTSVNIITDPIHGTTSVDPITGKVTYTPESNFVGLDTFAYVICDKGTPSLCDSAQVIVNVGEENDPPTITQAPLTTPEDSVLTFCPTLEDPDFGDNLTVSSCEDPANGTITVDANNCVTYTPNPNFNGLDSMCLVVCDDAGICDSVIVSVTVTPVNDAPIATTDNPTTDEDTPVVVDVLDNDTDIEGLDPTTVDVITPPTNGTTSVDPATGEVTYTPNPDFVGQDTLTYVICDTGVPVLCDTANAFITVQPVNDAPTITQEPVTAIEDTPLTFCPTISDPDSGDVLTVGICEPPINGTATVDANNCITYTPDENFVGQDSMCLMVCDAAGLCDSTPIMIPIDVTPVNDAPNISQPDIIVPEDSTITFCPIIEDLDLSDALTVSICKNPQNGSATVDANNCVTYTPAPDYNGQDSICLIVCDAAGLCDSTMVAITITPVLDDIALNLKVKLQGALLATSYELMRDDLRNLGLIPLKQPYNAGLSARFTQVGGGNEVTTEAVLNSNVGTGDAIVDWIFLEFRDPTDPSNIAATMSALVQRDGDVVAPDGGQLFIPGYLDHHYIAVKHRNHIGVMTGLPIDATNKLMAFDFTSATGAELFNFGGYEGMEQVSLNDVHALWAGNANADNKTKYDGAFNDRNTLVTNITSYPTNTDHTLNFNNAIGYLQGDVNMDGKAKYDGIFNDRIIIQNIIIIQYGLNMFNLLNYNNLIEQIP